MLYALLVNSDRAIAQAHVLGMNRSSYMYKTLTDPRYAGKYLVLTVEDGEILNYRVESSAILVRQQALNIQVFN